MVPKKIGKNKISVRSNITKEIKLAEIVVELDMQSRAELDDEITKEYAEDINLGADFPPVDVFNDGTYYFLTDGFGQEHHDGVPRSQDADDTEAALVQGGSCHRPYRPGKPAPGDCSTYR
ncbi:MAG: hypothetical protein P8X68_04060 [Desulfobacterales bacterium]|jgi:hypothetical protein